MKTKDLVLASGIEQAIGQRILGVSCRNYYAIIRLEDDTILYFDVGWSYDDMPSLGLNDPYSSYRSDPDDRDLLDLGYISKEEFQKRNRARAQSERDREENRKRQEYEYLKEYFGDA